MSRELIIRCNRCNKVLEEEPLYIRVATFTDFSERKEGDAIPKAAFEGSFDDLCKRCQNTVQKTVEQVMAPYKRRGRKAPITEVPATPKKSVPGKGRKGGQKKS